MSTRRTASDSPDDESNPFGPDLWLHVASDSIARYGLENGVFVVAQSGDLYICLPGVTLDDPRLHSRFSVLPIKPEL